MTDQINKHYGSFIRLLMQNTNKNSTTNKEDIKKAFGIKNKDVADLINFTKSQIHTLGLEIVGVEKNLVVDPLISEKYTLRRSTEKQRNEGVIDDKVILVYSLIKLEGDKVSLSRLVRLCSNIHAFRGDSIEDYLQYLKRDKYINILKEDNEMVVELGYRYFVEYDKIDILDLLE